MWTYKFFLEEKPMKIRSLVFAMSILGLAACSTPMPTPKPLEEATCPLHVDAQPHAVGKTPAELAEGWPVEWRYGKDWEWVKTLISGNGNQQDEAQALACGLILEE